MAFVKQKLPFLFFEWRLEQPSCGRITATEPKKYNHFLRFCAESKMLDVFVDVFMCFGAEKGYVHNIDFFKIDR